MAGIAPELQSGSLTSHQPPQPPPAHSEIWQRSSSHSLAPLTSSHSALAPAYRRSSAPHAPPPTLRHHVCSCVTAHHASARRAAATRKLLTAELSQSIRHTIYGVFSKSYPAGVTAASPVLVPIEVIGTLAGAGNNGADAVAKENRTVVLRPSEWSMTYGAHGALASDWRWAYRWNSEGRLAGLETRDTAVTSGVPNLKLKFAYDDQGRRIQKTVLYLVNGRIVVESFGRIVIV
jgi:hypothetical protein